MDARAPASMRLLLSYSRARRSILLSPSKGGRGDIEARARLLRSAGGAPWRDVEARAANGDQGRD
jgi:hypothetical protein